MNRLDDDRLLFFIEHADRIRTWAALGREVAELTDRLLDEVHVGFESRSDLPDVAVARASSENKRFPHLALHREAWQDDAGEPLVRVAVSWDRRNLGLDPAVAPYVGVTTNPMTAAGSELSRRLRVALTEHRAAMDARATDWWPTKRAVPARIVDGSIDLDRYEATLIEELRREWSATERLVGSVLSGA